MARLSNETLSQTLSSTVNRLEKRLKADEENRKEHLELLNERLSRAQDFQFDLAPVKAEFDKQRRLLKETSEEVKEDITSYSLTSRALIIYFGTVLILIGTLLLFVWLKDRQIDEAKNANEVYKSFIQSSPQRTADFQKWHDQ